MGNQKKTGYKFKKDKYVNSRGGNSHFLKIYCSMCDEYLLLYQKDGKGKLHRLYLDRIFYPEILSGLSLKVHKKEDIPPLKCFSCSNLVGVPMVYGPEKRFAYRLIHGTFKKKK